MWQMYKGKEIDEKNNRKNRAEWSGSVYFRGVRWPGRHDFVSLEQHKGMKLMPTRFKPLASCHCPSYEAGTFSCVVTRVDAFAGVHLVSILGGQGLISSCPAGKDCHRLKVNNDATFFTRFSINYWQTSTETQPKSFSNHNSSNFCLEASLATSH